MSHFQSKNPGELPDVRHIARRIRACCMERGWDEVELARRAEVSRTTLYNLRNANCHRPRITTLTRLADAFEVSLDRFLWGEGHHSLSTSHLWEHGSKQFDRSTNHEIQAIREERPELFDRWTDREWDELYSTFGVGGALSPEGVISQAEKINQARETQRQLNVLLETHLKDVATHLVESLYRMVVPEGNLTPGKELEALISAHFESDQSNPSGLSLEDAHHCPDQ